MPEDKKPEDLEFSDVDFSDVEETVIDDKELDDLENGEGEDDDSETDKEEDEENSETDNEDEDENDEGEEGEEDETGSEETSDSDYKADYTYKVHNETFEIDDMFKPLITDKESEDKIRDLVTRAEGLSKAQESRDNFKTRLQETETQYTNLHENTKDTYFKSVDLYKKGHKAEAMMNLFRADDVMEVASIIEKYNSTENPEEKKMIQNNFMNNFNSYESQNVVSDAQKRNQELTAKNVELEMDHAINYDPEVKKIAEWVDKRKGENFFKKRVYNHAAFSYNTAIQQKSRPLTTKEYVRQIRDEYSQDFTDFQALSQSSQNPSKSQKATGNANLKKPSRKDRIPTVKGKGSIVGKKKFTDLKEEEQTFDNAKKMLKEEEEEF